MRFIIWLALIAVFKVLSLAMSVKGVATNATRIAIVARAETEKVLRVLSFQFFKKHSRKVIASKIVEMIKYFLALGVQAEHNARMRHTMTPSAKQYCGKGSAGFGIPQSVHLR